MLKESKKQLGLQDKERRLLHHKMLELKGTVRVACRVRPILNTENNNDVCKIEFNSVDNSIKMISNQFKDVNRIINIFFKQI